MNQLTVLLLCVLAFACLALAMERHQQDLFRKLLGVGETNLLRVVGWALLFASLVVTLFDPRWTIALVAWFGFLSAGAGVVFGALVLISRWKKGRHAR